MPLISAKEITNQDNNQGASSGAGDGGEGMGESVPAAVEEERRHHVEAAIVRIMKARKTLSHNELVMETTRQLAMRFTPNPQVQIEIDFLCLADSFDGFCSIATAFCYDCVPFSFCICMSCNSLSSGGWRV